MSPIGIGLLTFACLFAGALFGMRLRNALPDHHVSEDSRHLLQTGLGIIGTMAGLILGLLVASATNSYNAQRGEVLDAASKVVLLDRVLAHYGPETDAPRPSPNGRASAESDLAPKGLERSSFNAEYWSRVLLDEIGGLAPNSEVQKTLKPEAMGLVMNLAQTRWLMSEQAESSISMPLLVLLIFWFSITFVGFGLFAPWNTTVVVALALCTLAVSGAVFVMAEMYTPFQGLMQISSAPLVEALGHLSR